MVTSNEEIEAILAKVEEDIAKKAKEYMDAEENKSKDKE